MAELCACPERDVSHCFLGNTASCKLTARNKVLASAKAASRSVTRSLLEDRELSFLGDFADLMDRVAGEIKDDARQGATDQEWLDAQAMCVVEEAGEFIGEYRRLRGFARRAGDREQMTSELADVIISAAVMFSLLGEDLEEAVLGKLRKIVSRGYVNKDQARGPTLR